jgi:hypothetical protein
MINSDVNVNFFDMHDKFEGNCKACKVFKKKSVESKNYKIKHEALENQCQNVFELIRQYSRNNKMHCNIYLDPESPTNYKLFIDQCKSILQIYVDLESRIELENGLYKFSLVIYWNLANPILYSSPIVKPRRKADTTLANLWKQANSGMLCDVTFKIGKEIDDQDTLKAHKNVLIASST